MNAIPSESGGGVGGAARIVHTGAGGGLGKRLGVWIRSSATAALDILSWLEKSGCSTNQLSCKGKIEARYLVSESRTWALSQPVGGREGPE